MLQTLDHLKCANNKEQTNKITLPKEHFQAVQYCDLCSQISHSWKEKSTEELAAHAVVSLSMPSMCS